MENPDSVFGTGVHKVQTYKPGSVISPEGETLAICLIDLPFLTLLERAAPNSGYTWSFNPQGLPHNRIAPAERELLPHIFTLTYWDFDYAQPPKGGYFLRHLLSEGEPSASIFIECGALCCPDFPPSTKGGQRQGGLRSKSTLLQLHLNCRLTRS